MNVKTELLSKDEFKIKISKKIKPCLIIWDISEKTKESLHQITILRKQKEISDIPFIFLFDSNLIPGTKEVFDLSEFKKGIKMGKITKLGDLINETLTGRIISN